jgi:hypothetical protein
MVQLPNLHTDPPETLLRAHFNFLMVSLVVWQRFPGIFKNEWPQGPHVVVARGKPLEELQLIRRHGEEHCQIESTPSLE